MSKRTWTEANLGDGASTQSPTHAARTLSTSHPGSSYSNNTIGQGLPVVSRKVKACTSCRKQKVRCYMDDGPPCKRCVEKGLSCVLNKSLQTLISERLPQTDALVQDLEMVCSSVQHILRTLNLPDLGPLQSTKNIIHTPVSASQGDQDDAGPSCDNSPKLSPEHERDLPKVPIESVYHLTKLSALRSPDFVEDTNNERQPGSSTTNDFIAQGLVSLQDAERLYGFYLSRLDDYIYGVGGRYTSLSIVRQKSPILTASILTVAAMHDPKSNSIYPICQKEFRRLTTDLIFDRHIDRDHLRALCIASYWLNDASWMLAGVASRRAATLNIAAHFSRLEKESNEDAADFVRICNNWRPAFGRQVALLTIIHKIRELFGADADQPIPVVFLTQINNFSRQLDQWVGHWTSTFPEYQENFGTFPRKGALFHFQFAKLYLFSHIFRGLGDSEIPMAFMDAAHGATAAATSIINMIITEPDVRVALVGLPCYLQSMIGFACMFLAKLNIIHGDKMIQRRVVIDLISRLIEVYRMTPVGKWHLVHLLPKGLDRIVAMLQQPRSARPNDVFGSQTADGEIGPAVQLTDLD
ncbi:Zn 2cys6 transcription factor [Fusarium albosuccineum]|uniref:Zn 2cys6 transcription factor n=1 Tax=Fusarium albosuccineum TaxID=1237068 RepID=A0A8H4PAG9_9HYPO|nr:Zn 2cys6 transcription factor [Fusarium albosuccineum]